MAKGLRSEGEFCWINILTPRPAEAQRFFSELFGWTYTPMSGIEGSAVHVGDSIIGGLWDLDHPMTPAGTPPLIGTSIKVASADAIADAVVKLGGTAKPPMDIFDQGRMVVCRDPDGAEFDVWEARKMPGTDVDGRVHGAPGWFQVMVRDADRAARFYAQLLGWKAKVFPERGGYTVFCRGEHDVAGMMPIVPQMNVAGPAQPGWSTWFTVDDVDATAKRAQALGAKLCVGLHDIPAVGRFCAITSPGGVPFHVIRWQRS